MNVVVCSCLIEFVRMWFIFVMNLVVLFLILRLNGIQQELWQFGIVGWVSVGELLDIFWVLEY